MNEYMLTMWVCFDPNYPDILFDQTLARTRKESIAKYNNKGIHIDGDYKKDRIAGKANCIKVAIIKEIK